MRSKLQSQSIFSEKETFKLRPKRVNSQITKRKLIPCYVHRLTQEVASPKYLESEKILYLC